MAGSPRPYLRADARRRQLLDAAARCFVRSGFGGLTMVAVAAEAGVSRRLVYDHFPDLASLYDAFFEDRVSRYLGAIDRAVADAGADPGASFAGAFELLLAVPPDDQRVLRLVVADPGLAELAPVRERLRAHIEARWLPLVAGHGLDGQLARAVLWTLVSALFGLADQVARGELTAPDAIALATAFVAEAPRAAARALVPAP